MTRAPFRLGRNYLYPNDPCRVRGKRGLWRYIGVERDADGDRPATLELVGPDHNPRTRFLPATVVRRVQPTEITRARVLPYRQARTVGAGR